MNYERYAQNYALFFENLNKDMKIDEYALIFDEKVYFEDPFQKTYDLESFYKIYVHMYESLYEPRFLVKEIALTNNVAYLQWSFIYKTSKDAQIDDFTGVTRVEFNEEGKAISHIDYWDSATNIYEKIPILKNIISYIKNRIKA